MTVKTRYIIEAEDRTKAAIASAQKGFAGLAGSVRTLLAPLAALGAVSGLANFVGDTIKTTAALKDTSDMLGITAEQLQELRYAADQSGVSTDNLDSSMAQFARRVGEARAGTGDLLKEFERYGVALTNADGTQRSMMDLLRAYADVMQRAESDQERLRLATEAFERAGGGMVNVLRDGSAGLDTFGNAAREAGAVLENDFVATAAKIDDEWAKRMASMTTAAQSFVLGVLNEWDKLLGLEEKLDGLNKNHAKRAELMRELNYAEVRLSEAAAAGISEQSAAYQNQQKKIEAIRAELRGLASDAAGLKPANAPISAPPIIPLPAVPEKPGKKSTGGGGADPFAAAVADLQRQAAAVGALTEYERVLYEVQSGRYKSLSAAQQNELLDLAKVIDAKEQAVQADKDFAAAVEASEEAVKAENESYQDWLASVMSAGQALRESLDPQQALAAQLAEYNMLLKAGAITLGEYEEAAKRATDQAAGLGDVSQELDAALSGSMAEFLKGLATGETSLKDAAFDFATQIQGVLSDQIAGMLTEKLGLGDLLGGLMDRGSSPLNAMWVKDASQAPLPLPSGGAGGGDWISTAFEWIAGLFHSGGIVGQPGASRVISPAAFIDAPRYHGGGFAGLRPGEVPAIQQRGEEVLPASDPRHAGNGGVNVRIVNVESMDKARNYLESAAGERLILNAINRNRGALGLPR